MLRQNVLSVTRNNQIVLTDDPDMGLAFSLRRELFALKGLYFLE
jgi:hypothetical protein